MSNLFICEHCGAVHENNDKNFCLICHCKLIPLNISEEEANNKYKDIMENSKNPICERNECIRQDYFYNKIENPKAEKVISDEEYKAIYDKGIYCPICKSDLVWSTGDNTYICRNCKTKWEG